MMLLALVLLLLLGAAGSAAVLTGRTETLVAASFRQGTEAVFAADGAVAAAIHDLAGAAEWTSPLSMASTFTDGPPGAKVLPGGSRITLCCGAGSLTEEVQRRADAAVDWGGDTPRWQLYVWGAPDAWPAAGNGRSVFYVAAWVADDPADGDRNPAIDTNAVVQVIGVALGPMGARRSVRALVARTRDDDGVIVPGTVRILSWRESRW